MNGGFLKHDGVPPVIISVDRAAAGDFYNNVYKKAIAKYHSVRGILAGLKCTQEMHSVLNPGYQPEPFLSDAIIERHAAETALSELSCSESSLHPGTEQIADSLRDGVGTAFCSSLKSGHTDQLNAAYRSGGFGELRGEACGQPGPRYNNIHPLLGRAVVLTETYAHEVYEMEELSGVQALDIILLNQNFPLQTIQRPWGTAMTSRKPRNEYI